MPRLRNSKTGVVVNVSDEAAKRLGSDWKPHAKKAAPKKAAEPEQAPSE